MSVRSDDFVTTTVTLPKEIWDLLSGQAKAAGFANAGQWIEEMLVSGADCHMPIRCEADLHRLDRMLKALNEYHEALQRTAVLEIATRRSTMREGYVTRQLAAQALGA